MTNVSCVSQANPSGEDSVYSILYTSPFNTDYSTPLRGAERSFLEILGNTPLDRKISFSTSSAIFLACLSTLPPLGSEQRAFPHNVSVSSRSPTRSTPRFRGCLDRQRAVNKGYTRVGSIYRICLVIL